MEAETEKNALKDQGESILIVDDDPVLRMIASDMLTFLGFQAKTVDNGEAALSYIKKQAVDLMLLDMNMPGGMDGAETYNAVIKIRPGQKVIIVSGVSESEDVTEALRLGAGTLLKKPYTVEKLGQAVISALNHRQMPNPS